MFLCQYENNYLEIFSLNNEFNFIFYENNVVGGVINFVQMRTRAYTIVKT